MVENKQLADVHDEFAEAAAHWNAKYQDIKQKLSAQAEMMEKMAEAAKKSIHGRHDNLDCRLCQPLKDALALYQSQKAEGKAS